MATLTVWKFSTPEGAQGALDKLQGMAKQQLIQIQDAAVVSWPQGKKSPKTRNLGSSAATGGGALMGAFWGMLFGLIFFVPFFGLAVGAAMGAMAGKFSDYGIDDNFIKQVREQVTPGTSALFLLTSGAVEDKIREAFKGTGMQLVQSNLSKEQEERLREEFAE